MANTNLFPNNPELTELSIVGRDVTELPNDIANIYPNLVILLCHNTRIKKLPDVLPPKLKELICTSNELESLPILPITLEILDISRNFIKYLPEPEIIPPNLLVFRFHNNTLFRYFPDRLHKIYQESILKYDYECNYYIPDYKANTIEFYRNHYFWWFKEKQERKDNMNTGGTDGFMYKMKMM